MSKLIYKVDEEFDSERIDKYISEQSEQLSRSYIQKLIKEGNLTVNDKIVKSNYQIKADDIINLEVPANIDPEILPEDIKLDILYEDEDIILINKAKGMVVHPGAGHYSGTVVNALLHHCTDLSGINGVLRPGIVHRIDKDTSGVIICAKNDFAHQSLSEQLKQHSITRKYEAIVVGLLSTQEGTIESTIGRNPNDRKLMASNVKNGKHAVTHYKVMRTLNKNTFIECELETGRTHQIRVHMSSIHHPILGDTIYGGKISAFKLHGQELQGQTLHAKTLGFIHPRSHKYMEFEAERPDYFKELLKIL